MNKPTAFNYGDYLAVCAERDRLKAELEAYKDTGLEPEDLKKVFNEDAVLKLAGQALGTTPYRLRELAAAGKDGRCVVLPCAAGERWKDEYGNEVVVDGFFWDARCGWCVTFRFDDENGDDLNAVNFVCWEHNMTRPEAEKALEEGGK